MDKNLKINLHLTPKQREAWEYLFDDTTTEFLFGGGAGGGKSKLGCMWLLTMALKYAKTRWLLGRSVLKNLKASTLNTMFEVFSEQGIKEKIHYKYNQQDNVITLFNGSEFYLLDLEFKPSDPNYDRIGSTEFTGGFIDEANQITAKCRDVVSSRLRYKISQFGIVPKLLMTCNPAKNWTYTDYYKPSKDGTLPSYRRFLQALVTDNPFISPHYIESLKRIKDKALRERLLFGNWEYDDDPSALFSFDALSDLFTNNIEDSSDMYMIVDVARFGADRTVVGIWRGLKLIAIHIMERSKTTEVVALMDHLAKKYKIPRSHELVDEDGVGGGVVDLRECKGFVGASSPINEEFGEYKVNYQNLRAQCYYTLADLADNRRMRVEVENEEYKQLITEELEQIKTRDMDKDGKLKIVSKEEIKEHLGRSPDFADMIMMRTWFEVAKEPEPGVAWI